MERRKRKNGHSNGNDLEVVEVPKRQPGFQKGHIKYGGRKLGTPNKEEGRIKRAMREWMEEAAHLFGYDGKGQGGELGFYIKRLEENPDLFCELLMKLQPKMVQAAIENRHVLDVEYETVEEAKEALAREGILLIEHQPQRRG